MLVRYEVTARGPDNEPAEFKVITQRASWVVRVGQIWRDCDKRVGNREVLVIGFSGLPGWPATNKPIWARCRVLGQTGCRHSAVPKNGRQLPPREVRIRLDRMRPGSTGFELRGDAPRVSHESSLPY